MMKPTRSSRPKRLGRWARVALIGLGLAALGSCAHGPRYRVSDHYDGTGFVNPVVKIEDPGLFGILWHVVAGRRVKWPEHVENRPALHLDARLGPDEVAVTFVNHATVLVQMGGLNILTDPVWSERVGPYSWAGPKRARDPGIPFDALPPIDLILISHNHYDHLDLPTLARLARRDRPQVLVPLGDGPLARSAGFARVRALDWWESVAVRPDVEVTFTPAQHSSGRGIFDKKDSLWGSFMIRAGALRVYFGGDSAFAGHYQSIRERLGAPDLALLPIGAYAPRVKHRPFHMDPADAVRALLDLGATRGVGIHHGTFKLTNEPIDQPRIDLAAALRAHRLPASRFGVLGEGRTRVYRFAQARGVTARGVNAIGP